MSLTSADKLGMIVAISIVIIFVGIGVGMSNVSPTVSDRPGMEQQAKSVDPKFKDEKKESTEKELLDKERDLKEKQREAEIKKAEEKNLEERKAEIKKAEEKNLEERKAEIKKAEEKNLEERKAEIKKAEEKKDEIEKQREIEIKKAEEKKAEIEKQREAEAKYEERKNLEEKDTTASQSEDDGTDSTGRDFTSCPLIDNYGNPMDPTWTPHFFIPDRSISSLGHPHFEWSAMHDGGCPIWYNIERSDDNEQTWTVVASVISLGYILHPNVCSDWIDCHPPGYNHPQLEYTDTSALPGQSYVYRFETENHNGSNGYWDWNVSTVHPSIPYVDQDDSLMMMADDVLFGWDHDYTSSSGTDLFEVLRSDDNITWYSLGSVTPYNCIICWWSYDFVDTNVNIGQTYYYKVRAHNVFGYSGFSDVVQFTPTVSGPDAPTNLSVTQLSTFDRPGHTPSYSSQMGRVHLTWDPPLNLSPSHDYAVFWTEDPNNWDIESDYEEENCCEFFDSVDPETTYYYKVRVWDYTQGISNYSTPLAITTLPAPDAPTNLSVTHVSNGLQITWDEPNGHGLPILQYEVYRTSADVSWYQISHISTNTAFIDTSVMPATPPGYRYTVSAWTQGGEGELSQRTDYVIFDNSVPDAPTNLAVTQSIGTHLLTWDVYNTPSSGIPVDSFEVLRSLDNITWSVLDTIPFGESEFNDTLVVGAQTYYYKVRALNIFGYSDSSNVVSLTHTDVPDAPTIAVTQSSYSNGASITWSTPFTCLVSCTLGHGIDFYYVQRSHDNVIWSGIDNVTVINDPAVVGDFVYVDNGVGVGQTYYYRVQAHNTYGFSDTSNVVSFAVSSPPDAPTNLSVTWSSYSNGASITWDVPFDGGGTIDFYNLSRSDDNISWSTIQNLVVGPYHLTVGATTDYPPVGQTYYYRVQAHNEFGWGDFSDVVSYVAMSEPDRPTNLATTIGTSSSGSDLIILSWNESNDNCFGTPGCYINFYNIKRSEDGTIWNNETLYSASGCSSATSCPTVPMTANFQPVFEDELVIPGHTYYYMIRAHGVTHGYSPYSNIVSILFEPVPNAPTNVALNHYTDGLHLTWDEPNNANTPGTNCCMYEISRSDDGMLWTTIGSTSQMNWANSVYSMFYNIVQDQMYHYKVRAQNDFGWSEYSDTVSLPAILSPDAPIILSVHDISISQTLLSLSWYHPNPINVDEYRIERSNDNVTWQLVAVESQLGDRFIDNNVLSGQVYYYRIQAYNMVGFSDYSNIFSGIPN